MCAELYIHSLLDDRLLGCLDKPLGMAAGQGAQVCNKSEADHGEAGDAECDIYECTG